MMKMIQYLVMVVLSLCFGCSQKGKYDNKPRQPITEQGIDSIKLLQGNWAKSENENVLFTIKGDSLFYFEDPSPVYYKVENNTLKIYLEGEVYSSQILKLTQDSLIRIEYDEVVRLYKR